MLSSVIVYFPASSHNGASFELCPRFPSSSHMRQIDLFKSSQPCFSMRATSFLSEDAAGYMQQALLWVRHHLHSLQEATFTSLSWYTHILQPSRLLYSFPSYYYAAAHDIMKITATLLSVVIFLRALWYVIFLLRYEVMEEMLHSFIRAIFKMLLSACSAVTVSLFTFDMFDFIHAKRYTEEKVSYICFCFDIFEELYFALFDLSFFYIFEV